MADDTMTIDDLRERLAEVRVAMVTTIDEQGLLSSRPMTVQRIDDAGNAYFIVARDADWTIDRQTANVALIDADRTWVSIAGRVEYVHGTSLLSDLWDDAADAWFPDGQDSAIPMVVRADHWEYWTAPNKFGQLAAMAKAFLMDDRPEVGESGRIAT